MLTLLSLAFITLLAAMSPGPDFAIITRYALTGSRKTAFLASLGIALALLIHVTYCALGVAIILVESPLLFQIVQGLGSCYLGYLGFMLLFSSNKKSSAKAPNSKQAFLSGFTCNLLNPKATLFIFGIFTQFVDETTPLILLIAYGLIIAGIHLAWFNSLIFLITHSYFRAHFERMQNGLMKGMGVILLGLALFVLSKSIFAYLV